MASKLLNMCPDCAKRAQDDLAPKLLSLFRSDFEDMEQTGRCSTQLWVIMLMVRAMTLGDSQEVEGYHALLQAMCRRAPAMKLPLANARMGLKFGKEMSVERCCELHREVVLFEKSDTHAHKLALVSQDELAAAPVPQEEPVCDLHINTVDLGYAVSLTLQFSRMYEAGAAFGFCIMGKNSSIEHLHSRPCFLIGWKYRVSHVYCIESVLVGPGPDLVLKISLPLVVKRFVMLANEHMYDSINARGNNTKDLVSPGCP